MKTTRSPIPFTARDARFAVKVDAWQPMRRGFLEAFGRERLEALNARQRSFCPEKRRVAFLTFESSLAPLGGLAAVARLLPDFLRRAGESVIVLTPLFADIPRVKEAIADGFLEPALPGREFRLAGYSGVMSCLRAAAAPVPTYYVAVEGRFTAALNPYSYSNGNDILDDSLAFCAAAPFVLKELGLCRDLLFHAHDWETAPVAITSKIAVLEGLLENARAVLTLHNSFDSGLGADRKRLFFGGMAPAGDTVLQCALPLLDGPLTTVSAPFAEELRSDPLQRTVFTNHLQGAFSANPPIGVENGMFGKPRLRYTYTALSHARQGACGKLLAEKAGFREAMLRNVAAMAGRDGAIGGLKEIGADGGIDIDAGRPIFFMSGRLDLMQKGFDAVFHAMSRFPAGKAGLIFCPSSAEGARRSAELDFFRDMAQRRPGDIAIWPFRITEGEYAATVSGSSFLLMPSFYEPFGAATEGFAHGTPVVARATGGLTVQVRPPRGAAVGTATGLLYREAADEAQARDGWRALLNAPVDRRISIPLYQSMVDEAFKALSEAADIYADGDQYGRMMVNCMDSLKEFSWETAAAKYRRVYEAASRRGFFDE